MANQKSVDPSRQVASMLLSDRALTPEEIASVATPDIALKDSGVAALSEADQPAGTSTTVSSDAGSTATGETSPTTTLANAATDTGGQPSTTNDQGAQAGDDLLGLGAGESGNGANAATEHTTENPKEPQEGLTLTGSDGKPLTADQVLRLSPKQKIELEDGTITDIQTLRANGYFKNEYDNRVRTLNQREQELEEVRKAAAIVAPYASSIEQSNFAKAYLENFRLTNDEGRALAAASAATGIALPQQATQNAASQEPKKLTPEMDEYYEQDPAALGIEYATPEWDQFILKGSAALARLATRREHERIANEAAQKESERRRTEEARQAEIERAQSIDNTILNRNKQVLAKMGEIYAEEQKINLSALTVQQRTDLMQSITETFQQNGMNILDEGYLKNNFLDETHLRFVAMRTPFSATGAARASHTPAAPMVVPPSPTTATQSSQPVNAGGQSATIPDRVDGAPRRETEGQQYRSLMNQLLS